MNFDDIKKIYFIGIGGIGVSALAQLFLSEGKEVSGSDLEKGNTSYLIEIKGAVVKEGHASINVPSDANLVIYSDSTTEANVERIRAKELGIPTLSYFEALGLMTKDRFTIAVAGTHGKTTSTAMLTKILYDAEIEPTAIVGSIVKDFESNFVRGSKEPFVVEACEYKDHLLKLHPNILVINNIELDHTDYFKDLKHVQATFRKAIELLPEHGILVTNTNDPNIKPILNGLTCTIIDYTQEKVGKLSLPGEHNVLNAQSAKAAAKAYSPMLSGISIDVSLELFKGTWRRFEYRGKTTKGAVVYDDYAHHPTAVQKTLAMCREQFPSKHITVIFHPHLHSRTRDFFDEFAKSFKDADEVGILPIFEAREETDKSVSSEKLAEAINKNGTDARFISSFDEAKKLIESKGSNDMVITMGAGDVYKVTDQIVE